MGRVRRAKVKHHAILMLHPAIHGIAAKTGSAVGVAAEALVIVEAAALEAVEAVEAAALEAGVLMKIVTAMNRATSICLPMKWILMPRSPRYIHQTRNRVVADLL